MSADAICLEGSKICLTMCFVTQMDTLGKKYDQRFKAAGEVSSRLQAEEAAFRDIQVYQFLLYLYVHVCCSSSIRQFLAGCVYRISFMVNCRPAGFNFSRKAVGKLVLFQFGCFTAEYM